ncbi:MAG TPA: CDP-alcohol phosphatidyltransferase family protein [Candidatus Krumholzibacteria bacterium]|nr:CDP-alcohol phosphatidyltransferase family protein [Candidatus Krumholzibacteria bacterium]
MHKALWQERARALAAPLVEVLARAGITPTAVTLVGLVLNVAAGVWIGLGHTLLGGVVLLVASICDGLDGGLARRTGRVTRFGAFLDSTIDRIDETVVLAGIAAYFFQRDGIAGGLWGVAVLLALGGSLITSYTRARAEGLGLECKVGWFERPERLAVTILGLLLGYRALIGATAILVLFSWATVVQRIRHVQRLTASRGAEVGAGARSELPSSP